ncbi:ABC transporter permease [Paenibacillus cymbidii]|uniref:ABC transporter permease n=1 Tax=Paenibacillus cymbidii TaxID=1639034 RepID=UPI001F41C2E6|nr:ABC transporter permease subunit [Paenibacillus cymbidii]
MNSSSAGAVALKRGFFSNMWKYKFLYALILPGMIFFLVFDYVPMYGVVIAFQDYKPFGGIKGMFIDPNWVGLKHFNDFFHSYYFGRLLRNTVVISLYKLVFGFPAPIVLALMLNEVKRAKFKKAVQTISYMPHFLSWVIISGLVITILSPTSGVVGELVKSFGGQPISYLGSPDYFRSILVGSSIWSGIGWGSIIYLAALAGINPELYESAEIDGASRFQKMRYISIPGISNIIAILFVFQIGGILNAGFEQVLLLYSPTVYQVGDIIDTYVYREGLLNTKYSYSAAIGLFKNVVGLLFLIIANVVVKRMGKEGIW